jgi:hypothetical protein
VVPASEAAEVADVDTGSGEVTLTEAPEGFGDVAYDFVQANPHFDVLASGLSATLAGDVLSFDAEELPEDLAVGDYVALEGQSPIVNVPVELQDVLVFRALYVYLLSQGDPKAQAVKSMVDEAKDDALALISPRKDGSEEALINYYAPGWNRARRRFGGL